MEIFQLYRVLKTELIIVKGHRSCIQCTTIQPWLHSITLILRG